jgi:hypothetical protein
VVQVHLGPPRSQLRRCRGSRLQVLIDSNSDSNAPAEVVPRSWLSLPMASRRLVPSAQLEALGYKVTLESAA